MISIVVPYRPDFAERTRVWSWCSAHWRALLSTAEIIEADSGHQPFHRAASINEGVRKASGSRLIIADADTVVSNAVGLFVGLEGPRWFIGYEAERYFTLGEEQTEQVLTRAHPGRLPPPPPRTFGITSWSGVLGLHRSQFVGFDERFDDWGWEDRAFVHAMDTLHGPHARVDGYALHLWHPRGAEWASPGIKDRENLWRRYAAAEGNPKAMEALLRSASSSRPG